MATAYSTTWTSATSSTSGAINVSAYSSLWLALDVSAIDWTGAATVTVSRLDAFGNLFPVTSVQPGEGLFSLEIGEGFEVDLVFGDRIQVDMTTIDSTSITGTLSLIGK